MNHGFKCYPFALLQLKPAKSVMLLIACNNVKAVVQQFGYVVCAIKYGTGTTIYRPGLCSFVAILKTVLLL